MHSNARLTHSHDNYELNGIQMKKINLQWKGTLCGSYTKILSAQTKMDPELFPNWQILDSSKMKELAEDKFRLDENGRVIL